MKNNRIVLTTFVVLLVIGGLLSCRSTYHSSFVDQAVKPVDLVKVKYRMLKVGAVGESTGFKLLYIAFTNATADKGGIGFIGLIGAPSITLTADVIEILGEQVPQEPASPVQPTP